MRLHSRSHVLQLHTHLRRRTSVYGGRSILAFFKAAGVKRKKVKGLLWQFLPSTSFDRWLAATEIPVEFKGNVQLIKQKIQEKKAVLSERSQGSHNVNFNIFTYDLKKLNQKY